MGAAFRDTPAARLCPCEASDDSRVNLPTSDSLFYEAKWPFIVRFEYACIYKSSISNIRSMWQYFFSTWCFRVSVSGGDGTTQRKRYPPPPPPPLASVEYSFQKQAFGVEIINFALVIIIGLAAIAHHFLFFFLPLINYGKTSGKQ